MIKEEPSEADEITCKKIIVIYFLNSLDVICRLLNLIQHL
jgi:hypothetical protein